MNIDEIKMKELLSIFKDYKEIKLVYLFGSRVGDKISPLSDYDFAVYFDIKDKKRMYDIRFELFDRVSRILKTDNIEIVILNLIESPELKYLIIKYGRLLFEEEPFKIIIEPHIMNEYFDFQAGLERHNLTEAKV